VIPSFSLAGSVLSRNHGLATFVHERLEWSLVDQSQEQSESEWLCVDVAGYKIISVYKPANWGYNKTSDGESLDFWVTFNNLGLLYNPKETASFFSRRWIVCTNPDLAFASSGHKLSQGRLEAGCGVGGKISDSNFPKFPTPDSDSEFPKFPTPAPWHKGNETWMLKSMEVVVHSKKSLFQQTFQNKLYHFNRNSQFRSVM